MHTFSSFTHEIAEKKFHLKAVKQLPLLREWISSPLSVDEAYGFILNDLKHSLAHKVTVWNEDELQLFFIAPLVVLAEMGDETFHAFAHRALNVNYEGEEIKGRVDFIIARGGREPEDVCFCLHEYKQEVNNSDDPLGQLLVAMFAAQQLNESKNAILGAYVVGRYWFFVVLEGNEYAKSMSYDASGDDIFQIFSILQKTKVLIGGFV